MMHSGQCCLTSRGAPGAGACGGIGGMSGDTCMPAWWQNGTA